MTEDQKAKANAKLARRLASIYENESSWDCIPGQISMELKGDSQCVIRWLERLYFTGNLGFAAKVAEMQNLLYDMSLACPLRPPELGRNIFKWTCREGNAEAESMTWEARTGNCRLWYDECFLNLIIMVNAVLID